MADSFNLKAIISVLDKGSPALKTISNAAKGARKYLTDVGSAAAKFGGKLGLPVGLLATIAGGFSIAAIKRAVDSFAEMGETLYKSSLKTGMSVEELQRYQYVAKQSGVEAEALEGSIGKLNKNIGNAAGGKNKELAGLFKVLGINMRDANGNMRTGADMLPELADAFLRNKNAAVQARMGNALFGKTWQEIIPLLMEGSAGINKTLERFKGLKSVMDLDTVKGAKEFGDQMKDLEIVTKGFQMVVAKELVPVLGPLIEDIIQWAAANRKVVASGVKEFAKDFIATMRSIDWAGILRGVGEFARGVKWAVDAIGGMKVALVLLVLYMNAQAIVAFGGLLAAVWRLGAGLLTLSATALPGTAAAITTMTGTLTAASIAAAALLLKLTAIAAVGMAAYEATKFISEKTGYRDFVSDRTAKFFGLESDQNDMVNGTGKYAPKKPVGEVGRPPYKAQVGGTIKIDLSGMPPGARLTEAQGQGGINFDTSVGYNSNALKLPY